MEQYEIDDMMTNLQDYLERQNINTSRFFRCINPQHIDSNASMKYFDDNKAYCFGCGACYDLVGAISVIEGLDRKSAFKKAKEYYYSGKTEIRRNNLVKASTEQKPKVKKDYEKAYYMWNQNYRNSSEAKKYIKERGISEQTAKRFNIGYNEFNFGDYTFKAVVIPISNHCFSARNISHTDELRYYKPRGSQTEIFNKEALSNDIPYCIITEGEFDCLSFETLGLNAIALSSANNYNKLIELEKNLDKRYILALDNDNAGEVVKNSLIEYFKRENIKFAVFDNCGFKDANKALVENKKEFANSIYSVLEQFDIKVKRIQDFEM